MKKPGYLYLKQLTFAFLTVILLALFPLLTSSVQAAATTTKSVIAPSTKYATNVYTIKADQPGPTVMVVGGIHGNEPSGYTSASQIKDWSIKKGTLIVLPEANKRAIQENKRAATGEADLNRSFPQTNNGKAANVLAKEIYTVAKDNHVDWLIDLHEGYDYNKKSSTNSVGQSVIYQPSTAAAQVTKKIVTELNSNIQSANKKFTTLRYPARGSLARSAADTLDADAMIVETCTKDNLNTRVKYHQKAVEIVLKDLKMK